MDFQHGKKLTISLDPVAGHVRSSDERFVSTLSISDFDISVSVVHAVHGHLDGPSSSRASLLVFKFETGGRTTTPHRRFRAFVPTLTFTSLKPRSEPRDDPWFVAREPAWEGGTISINEVYSKTTKTSSYQFSLSAHGPDIVPIEAGTEIDKSRSDEYVSVSRYLVSSGGRKDESRGGGRRGRNILYWNAIQNEKDLVGVDVMQVAVLICRANDNDFNVCFTFNADVDFRYDVANFFRRHKIIEQPFKTSENFRIPAGLDPEHLNVLEKNRELAKLAFVHDIEKAQPSITGGVASRISANPQSSPP